MNFRGRDYHRSQMPTSQDTLWLCKFANLVFKILAGSIL